MIKRLFRRIKRSLMKPPGGIDCDEVMAQLYEYIDGELDNPQQVEAIREHLRLCKNCFPQYEFESAFLRFIAERGGAEAPAGFRRRIFQRLLEQES